MNPKLAILMLSWLRFETLIETLKQIPTTVSQPTHLILRVQGMERLTDEDRQRVYDAACGFTTTDIYFTRGNVGTAVARLDLIHRGAKQGYEYLMFTDDDIIFPSGGIDHQIHILDSYPEIGSVSLRPKGIDRVQTVSENGVCLTTYDKVEETLCEVYLIGSASIMFRSLLYTKYLVAPDSAYYIGSWDWDFVMQIRRTGYKVCVLTDKSIVNKRGGNAEYRSKRRNRNYVVENRELFVQKWGFDPVASRRTNREFVKPVSTDSKPDQQEAEKVVEKQRVEIVRKPSRFSRFGRNNWLDRIHRGRVLEDRMKEPKRSVSI